MNGSPSSGEEEEGAVIGRRDILRAAAVAPGAARFAGALAAGSEPLALER